MSQTSRNKGWQRAEEGGVPELGKLGERCLLDFGKKVVDASCRLPYLALCHTGHSLAWQAAWRWRQQLASQHAVSNAPSWFCTIKAYGRFELDFLVGGGYETLLDRSI